MVLVSKVGDRTIESMLTEDALDDLERLSHQMPVVIVHGGGHTVTGIAEKLGVKQQFVTSPEGFRSRYTDADTIQIFTMVMAGKINKEIVRILQSRKIPAVGISGLDGALIRAERKRKLIAKDENGRRRIIDGGYTGRIVSVEDDLLNTLLKSNYVPVVAPVAIGSENEALNIDGDRAAAHIAGSLKAEVLILLTDVEGIILNGGLVRRLTPDEAKQNIANLGPGMITKAYAALEALSMGVAKVVVAPGRVPAPFSSAMNEETGTVIAQ